MLNIVRVLASIALGVSVLGCGGAGAETARRSKVVRVGSAEHQRAKAEQDQFERQAKEAELKALGSPHIE